MPGLTDNLILIGLVHLGTSACVWTVDDRQGDQGDPKVSDLGEQPVQFCLVGAAWAINLAVAARNTAMMQSLADLPPIVIADLFEMAAGTIHRWAQFAGNSWSDYLAALPDTAPGSWSS